MIQTIFIYNLKNKPMDYELETEEVKKGHPAARHRWRWQTHLVEDDSPMESEWEQFKDVAIKCAARYLIRNFEKFGKDDTYVKVFNEMNYQKAAIKITLEKARQILNN